MNFDHIFGLNFFLQLHKILLAVKAVVREIITVHTNIPSYLNIGNTFNKYTVVGYRGFIQYKKRVNLFNRYTFIGKSLRSQVLKKMLLITTIVIVSIVAYLFAKMAMMESLGLLTETTEEAA